MNYGLKSKHVNAINIVFKDYPEVEKAILYGSRAKGNYHNGSDIDLTLTGKNLTISKQFSIAVKLDNLLLPHKIDLSIYHKINNQELIDHINRVGVIFYKRNAQVDIGYSDYCKGK